jgi:hypothetical protein
MGSRREKKVSRPQIHIHRVLESPAMTTSPKVERGRWSETTTRMMRRHYRQDTVVEESPARR